MRLSFIRIDIIYFGFKYLFILISTQKVLRGEDFYSNFLTHNLTYF